MSVLFYISDGVKVEIVNQQKIKRVNLKEFRSCLVKILALLDIPSKKISVVFCDDAVIKNLNKRFFKRNSPTDVIAFPLKDKFDNKYLGEIVVSAEQAEKKSGIYGNSFKKELTLYLIHGVLHLLGYKDKTSKQKQRMRAKQQKILNKISV